MMPTKYVDMITCECCGDSYPDDDYCDYCMECECCGEMTLLNDMDIDFIDLSDMEVCKKCTKSWSKIPNTEKHLSDHILLDNYPKRDELGLPNKKEPTMAGFNGE